MRFSMDWSYGNAVTVSDLVSPVAGSTGSGGVVVAIALIADLLADSIGVEDGSIRACCALAVGVKSCAIGIRVRLAWAWAGRWNNNFTGLFGSYWFWFGFTGAGSCRPDTFSFADLVSLIACSAVASCAIPVSTVGAHFSADAVLLDISPGASGACVGLEVPLVAVWVALKVPFWHLEAFWECSEAKKATDYEFGSRLVHGWMFSFYRL